MPDTALARARALLQDLTPLKGDCGRVCGGACCQGSQEEGMLLFPGEDAFYAGNPRYTLRPLGKQLGGQPLTLLVCDGTCVRAERPLACRLFPLLCRPLESGAARMCIDPRARVLCPLCQSGVKGLAREFVDAAQAACTLLLGEAACADYLRALDAQLSL